MKRLLFLIFLLSACTYQQTISSNNKIDEKAKNVAVSMSNLSEIKQDLRQMMSESGFKIYNKNNDGSVIRYELVDDMRKDENVRCGLWEDGYTYEILFRDNIKKTEVFSMEGQGCRENILKDFTALINNRYGEKEKTSKNEDEDIMQVPTLKSDGRTWWSN